MNTKALSARPDLRNVGQRVRVVVEGREYGSGTVAAVRDGINCLIAVRLDGATDDKTFNARWVWAI